MFPAGHKYPPVRADAYNIQYASSTARHSRNLSSISTSTPTNGICKQEAFSSASASPQPSRFHLHTKSYRRRWCVCDIFRAMGRRVLRILCFGDSLTSGYFRWGMGSQPYSEVLSSRLQQEFPDLDVKVTTDGVPGDVASQPRFYDRFRRQCEIYSCLAWPTTQGTKANKGIVSSQSTYDWVIVLGGTKYVSHAPHATPGLLTVLVTLRCELQTMPSILDFVPHGTMPSPNAAESWLSQYPKTTPRRSGCKPLARASTPRSSTTTPRSSKCLGCKTRRTAY